MWMIQALTRHVSDAPPAESHPEAANFPTQTYAFNEDKSLFRAPKSYPEPPKDMWYKVPESRPAPPEVKPPPIFPWEQRGETARPSRIFIEDRISPVETPREELDEEPLTPITPTIKITSDVPWSSFESTNAWDQVQGIDAYVRALHQRTRSTGGNGGSERPGFAESNKSATSGLVQQTQFERRESLILTDFPSEIDRPSLPVTPAPMRRPTFWGKERDEAGALPSADGVPDQADWVITCSCSFFLNILANLCPNRTPRRNSRSLEGTRSFSPSQISSYPSRRSCPTEPCPRVQAVCTLRHLLWKRKRWASQRICLQRRRLMSPARNH